MNIALSYIAWNFFIHFFVINLFLILFMMSFQIATIAEFFFSQGLSWGIFFNLILSLGLSSLQLCVPLASFIGAIMTSSKLSAHFEYVSLRAIGLSIRHLVSPILLLSFFIGLCFFYINDEMIPKGRAQARRVVAELKSRSLLLELKSGTFFTALPGVTIFAEKVKTPGIDLFQVFVHQSDDKNPLLHRDIWAESGKLFLGNELDDSGADQGLEKKPNYLKLENATLLIQNPTLNTQEKIEFKTFNYLLPSLDSTFDVSKRAAFLTNYRLQELKKNAPSFLAAKIIDRENYADIGLEISDRYLMPMTIMMMAILGFLMGLGHFRVTQKNRALMAFLANVGYYGIFFFLSGLAKKSKIDVFLPQVLGLSYLIFLIFYWYFRGKWVLGTSVFGSRKKSTA